MEPLRIQIIIGQLSYGGSERHVVDLAANLDPGRVRPLVTALSGGPLEQELHAAGVDHEIVPLLSGLRPPVWDLWRSIRHFRPDAVYVTTYHDSLWGRLAALAGGVSLVVAGYRLSRRLWFEPLLSRFTPLVLANSSLLAAEYAQRYPGPAGRVHHLPNGVDTNRFRPADPSERSRARTALGLGEREIVALMPARFHPNKDQAAALRALARIKADGPPVRLVMAGEGPCLSDIKELALELGLGTESLFLPPHPQPQTLYQAADLVILATRAEGLPRVLVEGAACGLPLVAADVDGCAEIVHPGANGFLFPPGDDRELALHWTRLARKKSLRRELGLAGRGLVEKSFSLNAMTDRFQELVEAAAGKSEPGARP